MYSLIDAAMSRSRTMLSLLLFILVAGIGTYITIPKESSPDITIPIIYVSVGHQGISPTDAERLLVRPMIDSNSRPSWALLLSGLVRLVTLIIPEHKG